MNHIIVKSVLLSLLLANITVQTNSKKSKSRKKEEKIEAKSNNVERSLSHVSITCPSNNKPFSKQAKQTKI